VRNPASFAEECAAVLQDEPDELVHLFEASFGDWLPAKAYVQGKIAIQFDFWVRPDDVDGRLEKKVAIFQRLPGFKIEALQGRLDISHPNPLDLERIRSAGNGGEGWQEGSMFVLIGENPEPSEHVSVWAVRSGVWLAEFDEVKYPRVKAGDLPLPPFALGMSALLRRQLIEDWKGISSRRPLSVGADENPDEVIQRGSEVLNNVPGNGAPRQWRLALNTDHADVARSLHVYLGEHPVGLGFRLQEGVDERVERVEMNLRSLKLGEAPS
jgi:hypothetical protein